MANPNTSADPGTHTVTPEQPSQWRAARVILWPIRVSLAIGVLIQVIGCICSAIPFLALADLTHALTHDTSAVTRPLMWFLIGLGLWTGLSSIALLVTHAADVNLQANLRKKLAAKLARVPLGWFDDRSSGRVRQLIQNDVDQLHQLVAHTLVELTAGLLTPLVGVVACFILDWRLGLAALLPAVLYMVAFSLLARGNNKEIMAEIQAGLTGVSDAIVEYVRGVAVLKIFGRSEAGSQRFARQSSSFLHEFDRMVAPQMRAHSVAIVFLSAAFSAVVQLGLGIWFVAEGWTTPSNLLVVTIIAMLLPASFLTVALNNYARDQALDSAARIVEVLEVPELPEPQDPKEPAGATIRFADVTFGYSAGHTALAHFSAEFPENTVTALVGQSGSGKSTVAALAARFRDVREGSVQIGGVDVRELSTSRLRSMISMVFQDPQLLGASIAENIRLARPDASDGQVERAARAANIHDRIEALPRGYQSVIGDDARLSGGEAQRIAVARAFLADTPILLLDEATSATDPETETVVQEALARLTKGRTVLVIAHRLSTISGADNILVLRDGQLAESGTHQELLSRRGLYAQMWADMQQEQPETRQRAASKPIGVAQDHSSEVR